MVRRKYRRSDCDCLSELAAAIGQFSRCNKAQLIRYQESRQIEVTWHEWDKFFLTFFKTFKGITKFQYFRFDREHPGVVFAAKEAGGEEVRVALLKDEQLLQELKRDRLPPVLSPEHR